jgi:DNA-binding SARP family transcriptional activator
VTAPTIHLQLLDRFALRVDDQPVAVPPSSQRLLAFLALHDGPVTRAALATALWPGTTARRAAACLRSALWRLVKPTHALVVINLGALTLGPGAEVDVRVVRRFADHLANPPLPDPPPAEGPPLTALTADLLPGWTDPWVTDERDWFRQLCLRTLETLSARLHARGDTFHAHEAAAAAVRGDPLRESAHRRLIELHLADGNPAAALRQYSAYRTRLRTELGIAPSPEICRLVDPALAHRTRSVR